MLKNFFNETRFNFNNFLAWSVVAACFVYFFWVSGAKKEENHNVGEIKTACISIVTLILGYYYGSNKNSSRKDETIQQMSLNAAATSVIPTKILTEEDLQLFPKLSELGHKVGDTVPISLIESLKPQS